jgi:hypothetical protein
LCKVFEFFREFPGQTCVNTDAIGFGCRDNDGKTRHERILAAISDAPVIYILTDCGDHAGI